jgi:hypothetical protein
VSKSAAGLPECELGVVAEALWGGSRTSCWWRSWSQGRRELLGRVDASPRALSSIIPPAARRAIWERAWAPLEELRAPGRAELAAELPAPAELDMGGELGL